MIFFKDMKAYIRCPRSQIAEVGGKLIDVRWIDVNKGDHENPAYRSRLVGREYTSHKDDSLYAATPPLEALRTIISNAATLEKSAKDGKPCADLRALVENARARGALVSEREVRAWIAAARERRGRVPAPSAPPTRKRKRSPTPPRSTVIATATPPVVKPADRTLEGWGNVNPKSLAERLKSPGRDGNAVNWVEHFKTAGRRGLR